MAFRPNPDVSVLTGAGALQTYLNSEPSRMDRTDWAASCPPSAASRKPLTPASVFQFNKLAQAWRIRVPFTSPRRCASVHSRMICTDGSAIARLFHITNSLLRAPRVDVIRVG